MGPVFNPAGQPGALTGLEGAMSFMERASRQRMAEEAYALKQQEDEIMRPVRDAQNRANEAAAKNKLASLTQIENLRASANDEMPAIREAWAQTHQIDDPIERSDAQNEVLGRATKYESVAELAPEINKLKEVWATTHTTARTLANSQIITDRQRELADLKAQTAKEIQAANAERDLAKQELANKGKVDAVKARGGSSYEHLISSYQAAVEAGDTETANLLNSQITKRNHIAQPYSDAERIKTLTTEADAADAEGNPALAKAMRDRITYLTKRNNSGGDREAKLAAILGKTPAATPASAAGAATGKPQSTPAPASGTNPFSNLKF